MGEIVLITPTTSAVATKQPVHSGGISKILISADLLAGVEVVTIFVLAGSTWVPLGIDGAAVTLTATVPSIVLDGGVSYAVTKSATAGACGVYLYKLHHQ